MKITVKWISNPSDGEVNFNESELNVESQEHWDGLDESDRLQRINDALAAAEIEIVAAVQSYA